MREGVIRRAAPLLREGIAGRAAPFMREGIARRAAPLLLLLLAGCGTAHGTAYGATGASNTPTRTAAKPSWVKTLGPGVTVTAPNTVSPGQDSPGAVVTGVADAAETGKLTAACRYFQQPYRRQCPALMGALPSADKPTFKYFKLGYIAVKGNRALVGTTGINCVPAEKPRCVPNADPAAVFSSGKTFAADWAQAVADNVGHIYQLVPCIKAGGRWYGYLAQQAGIS